MEPRRDRKAVRGEADGRSQESRPGQLAEALMREREHAEEAGNADRAAADDRVIESERPAFGIEEAGRLGRCGSGLAPVEGGDRAPLRRPMDQESAAADAGGFGLDHGERDGHGDRGVDGAAAGAQDVAPGGGGQRIGGDNHVVRGQRLGDGADRREDQQEKQDRRCARRRWPPRARIHRGRLDRALAMGGANCGSMSQGKRIQVSWLTSVTKVSTSGRPAGLA